MKKILLIINRKSGGGAEVVFQNLKAQLSQKHEVNIFYHMEGNEPNLFKRLAKSFLKLRALRKRRFDVIISGLHEENFLNLIMFGAKKRILTIHSNELPKGKKKYLHNFMYIFASLQGCYMVFPSYNLMSRYEELVPNLKGQVISNGVIKVDPYEKLSNYRSNQKQNFSPIKRFLFVGRLVPQKNVSLLLLVFKKIVERTPEARLTIIGDGPDLELVKHMILTLDLVESVEILGWVENVGDLYSNYQALLFTSKCEGFGNTIVEALANGLYVFSTDCDYGPREILLGVSKVSFLPQGFILGDRFGLIQYNYDDSNCEISDRFCAAVLAFQNVATTKLETNVARRLSNYTVEEMSKKYENLF